MVKLPKEAVLGTVEGYPTGTYYNIDEEFIRDVTNRLKKAETKGMKFPSIRLDEEWVRENLAGGSRATIDNLIVHLNQVMENKPKNVPLFFHRTTDKATGKIVIVINSTPGRGLAQVEPIEVPVNA